MSRENVDLVRRFYEFLNAEDFDACSELLAPEFELTQPSLPDGGVYRGPKGFLRWAHGLVEAWGRVRWEPEQFLDGGESVVVRVRVVASGSYTGIEQVANRFQVIRVRSRQITFASGYGELQRALKAAGLEG